MKQLLLIIGALTAATALYMGGCKQADGERCQVNEDCESGVCNKAKGTCATDQDTMDIDASVVDGPPPDAAIDAPPDAP